MMGFLSPLLLALGAAVAVPIILHLYQRQHGPRVVFPALRYLRRAEMESARRVKLRQLLLLAVRAAALILLALAAARPVLRQSGVAHEPTAVAIILDNSLSSGLVLGERRVLDELKERALETIAQGTPEDRFWIVRAGAPWEPVAPAGPAEAAELVAETEVAAGAADLAATLQRARSLLAAGADGRAAEIQLLTDLQATGLQATLEATPDGPPVVVWTPRGEPPANAAIAGVEVGGGMAPRSGERTTLAATVTGTNASDTIPIRLTVDGRVSAAGEAPVGAAAVLPFPARSAGLVSGWVELDPDALRGDDRRYFVVRVQPPTTVALTRRLPFVDEALDVLEEASRVRRVDASTAEVVIAPAADGVAAARDGRTAIVVAPESALELPATNRRLAEIGVPWRFEPGSASGEARLVIEHGSDELIGALEQTRVRQSYRLERENAPGEDSVMIRTRDGAPWIVRGKLPGGGRYVLVASPLSEEASTLPTSAALLPLLDRMIGAWAAADPERTEAVPGERIPLSAAATAVERPDGTREDVSGSGEYLVPGERGIYRILAGDRIASAFAVNPPASESELERLSERALRAALPGWNLTLVNDADDWADAIYHRRLGRETWRPLVLLALAMLLMEGLIASAGRTGRAEDSGGTAPRAAATPTPVPVGAGAQGPNRRTS